MDKLCIWLLIIISVSVLSMGIYVGVSNESPSLKVIIPFCLLILGFMICFTVIFCKTEFKKNDSYIISNLIIKEKDSENEKLLNPSSHYFEVHIKKETEK